MDFPTLLGSPGMIHSKDTLCGDTLNALTLAFAAGTVNQNTAYYIPFVVETPLVAQQMAWENGATLNGTVDVGLYDAEGKRLVVSAANTQTGASVLQVANITDTVLLPGLFYMALASSSATATFMRSSTVASVLRAAGQRTQSSLTAGALTDPAVFAAANTILPALAVTVESAVI